jgi:hypothetical protein
MEEGVSAEASRRRTYFLPLSDGLGKLVALALRNAGVVD